MCQKSGSSIEQLCRSVGAAKTQSRSFLRVAAAFNHPGKLRALVGEEQARKIAEEQRAVAECRRRSACSPVLDMRFG